MPVFYYVTISEMEEDVLKLKENLRKQGVTGLALDIDETLSDTGPHWWNHMLKFHRVEGLTYEESLKMYKFIENVPEWQTQEAKDYITTALDSDEFNDAIPLLHESNRMVNKLNAIVPIVAYITARPENIRQATENWLIKHGFPKAPVLLRPVTSTFQGLETKNAWKAEVLKYLYPEVLGIVDDNTGLPSELLKVGYEGKLFLYGKLLKEINPEDYPFPVILSPDWNHVIEHFNSK